MAGRRELTLTGPGPEHGSTGPVRATRIRMIASAVSRAIRNRRTSANPTLPSRECEFSEPRADPLGQPFTLPPWNSLSRQQLGKKPIQLSDGDRSLCLKIFVYGELPIASDEMTDLEDTLLIEQTLHGCFGG